MKELRRSLWVGWSFVPWINWLSWFQVGLRNRKAKYFAYAGVYGIPFAMAIQAGSNGVADIAGYAVLSWGVGAVHALSRRKAINAEKFGQEDFLLAGSGGGESLPAREVDHALLSAAAQHRGVLSLATAAHLTRLPVDVVSNALDELARSGVAEAEAASTGNVVYRFPGLLPESPNQPPDTAALSSGSAPDSRPSSIAQRLNALQELQKSGLITSEEFSAKRSDILREL